MPCERVTINEEKKRRSRRIMLAPFYFLVTLSRTSRYEQSTKTEIASYVKLKVQENNADTLGWRRK